MVVSCFNFCACAAPNDEQGHLYIFSNEDGNAKDNNSEKSHSRLTFYLIVRFIGTCFLRLKLCEQKAIKCFSIKLNKYQELICYYVLAIPKTPKKVFSRSNFSDNSVQVLSPMHSNVQLLYLLLFFCRWRRRRCPCC